MMTILESKPIFQFLLVFEVFEMENPFKSFQTSS